MRATHPVAAACAFLTAVVLTACASGATMPAPADSGATRPPFQTTTPGAVGPTGAPADVPQAKWDAILADLARRGVTATPQLVSAESVTFSDGSLGCAEPGQSYIQSMIDGLRVLVRSEGAIFDYRFGADDRPRLCTR